MKENKYDDPKFFAAYSRFPRSVYGLSAAREWPALQGTEADQSAAQPERKLARSRQGA